MDAYVVHESDLSGQQEPGDTAETRITIDSSTGSQVLEQRVIRFAPGRSQPQVLPDAQGIFYVVSGSGTLVVADAEHELSPESGAYLRAGEAFSIDNPGPDPLLAVLVTAPAANGPVALPEPRVVHYRDRPHLSAGPDREFRYLVHRDTGSPDVTQFLGLVQPGRPADHSHIYDEVIYIISGHGTLHAGGKAFPVEPGTCIHLPPLTVHALENGDDALMQLLGVFHPSGDPASRA